MTRLTRLSVRCLTCKQWVSGCPVKHPNGETGWLRPVCRHCRPNRSYPFLVKPLVVTTVVVIKPGTPQQLK